MEDKTREAIQPIISKSQKARYETMGICDTCKSKLRTEIAQEIKRELEKISGEPRLLSDEIIHEYAYKNENLKGKPYVVDMEILKIICQAQLDLDIKHYER